MKIYRKKAYQQEEKLLEKIEKQEKLQLRDLAPALKRLEDYGFISKNDHAFVLTDKGRHARKLGIKNYLECERIEKEILRYSLQKSKKRGRLLWASFLLLILLFLLFAAINFDLFFESGF